MPVYLVTDPQTGQKVKLTGDSPPTEQELSDIFGGLAGGNPLDNANQPQGPQFDRQAAQAQALSDLAGEQSSFESGLIGAGRGLTKLGRLIGIGGEESDIEKQAFEALKSESPIATTIGEIAGESAPFLLPGLGQAGLAAKLGGGVVARAGTAAALGAAEAGTMAAADGKDVGLSAGVGAGAAATLELLAPKVSKLFRKVLNRPAGGQLITKNGDVSPVFEKALSDEGLTLNNLVEIAKLPHIAEEAAGSAAGRLTDKSAAKVAAKSVVVQQLKAGGRDDALAPIMLKGNKIVDDKAAKDAIRQGFEEGTVQLAKTANKETQKEMNKALQLAFDIKKQSRLSQTSRPSDFAGNALFDRVKFIKGEANTARLELNDIAKTQLKDAPFDIAPIRAKVNSIFEELDIEDLNPTGIPKPNFTGSQISGDKSSQKAISEMVRILSESKRTDALGGHMMKRQLDNLINFSKQPTQGLGKSGEDALKGVRGAFNDTLRASSDDYARVNDVMSKSLTGMDDLQKAVGKSVDLSMDGADRALGTSIRKLFSNQQKRVELDNSFTQLDDIAESLGGKFPVSYKDISQFSREIEDVFGKTAKTSFGGEIAGSIKSTGTQGVKATVIDKGLTKVAEKFSKQDPFEAFKAMREILRRGGE